MQNNNEKRLIEAYQAIENDRKRRDEIKKEVYEVGYKKPPVSG